MTKKEPNLTSINAERTAYYKQKQAEYLDERIALALEKKNNWHLTNKWTI